MCYQDKAIIMYKVDKNGYNEKIRSIHYNKKMIEFLNYYAMDLQIECLENGVPQFIESK